MKPGRPQQQEATNTAFANRKQRTRNFSYYTVPKGSSQDGELPEWPTVRVILPTSATLAQRGSEGGLQSVLVCLLFVLYYQAVNQDTTGTLNQWTSFLLFKSIMLVLGPSIRCCHCPHKTPDESLTSLHHSFAPPTKKKKSHHQSPSFLSPPEQIPTPPASYLLQTRSQFLSQSQKGF